MQYLVTMEALEDKIPTAGQDLVQHVEQVIALGEALVALRKEGKILAGGMAVGRKANVFIADVASNDELNQLLLGLPIFHIMEVDVTPLADQEGVVKKVRQNLERLKAATQ